MRLIWKFPYIRCLSCFLETLISLFTSKAKKSMWHCYLMQGHSDFRAVPILSHHIGVKKTRLLRSSTSSTWETGEHNDRTFWAMPWSLIIVLTVEVENHSLETVCPLRGWGKGHNDKVLKADTWVLRAALTFSHHIREENQIEIN